MMRPARYLTVESKFFFLTHGLFQEEEEGGNMVATNHTGIADTSMQVMCR